MRQPARTEAAARSRYIGFLQKALSCLTNAVWVSGPVPEERGGGFALTCSQEPIRLRRDADLPDLYLSVSQRFEIVPDARYQGEFKARTLAYVYRLSLDAAAEDSEILAWHWHPLTTPDRTNPHLHVGVDQPELGVTFAKLHVPTGRVSFEEVVRFLVVDLGVQPARDDWEDVIGDTEARFREFRTWA